MGIVTKNVGGDKYVYIIDGKKQFFLSQKGDLENVNQKNLLKALNKFNQIYDKQTKRYIESILSCIKYVDKKTVKNNIINRKTKMIKNVTNLKWLVENVS